MTETQLATDPAVANAAADEAFLANVFKPAEAAPASAPAAEETKNVTEAAEAAPVKSESEKPESVESTDADLAKAFTTLKLAGAPESVLGKLDRAEVLAWASKAKEEQTKTAKELQVRAERIKVLEAGATTKPAEPEKPTAAVDGDELEALKTNFGDELAAPLAKIIGKERARADERITFLEGLLERQLISSAKAGVREQFPQVDDPAKFAEILPDVRLEMGTGKYKGMEPEMAVSSAMQYVLRARFFEETRASEAGRQLAQHRQRLAAQPTPPTGKSEKPKPMTHAEREDAVLAAIWKGDVETKKRLMEAV